MLGAATLQDAGAHGVSLDLHHEQPAASAFHTGFLLPWVQKVEQDAGGRIRFHPHAGVDARWRCRGALRQGRGRRRRRDLDVAPTLDDAVRRA
jgi:hypothetical protein